MKKIFFGFLVFFLLYTTEYVVSQEYRINNKFLEINAKTNDPLYTTYTAAIERSRLYGDKGYKMDYYSDSEPLNYSSDKAGRIYSVWKIDKLVVNRMSEFARRPVVTASFSDMVLLKYSPFDGIEVEELFWVYSSKIALVNQIITNTSSVAHLVEVYPVLETGNLNLTPKQILQDSIILCQRPESLKRLISNMYPNYGYPEEAHDFFAQTNNYSFGTYTGGLAQFYEYMKTDFYAENFKNDKLNMELLPAADFVSLHAKFTLQPGETKRNYYFRGVQEISEPIQDIIQEMDNIDSLSIIEALKKNEDLFASVPEISFDRKQDKIIYLSAFNLARGCMLPPSGEARHNFYVFSREPKWGWGHGHQVLHESLSMLSYAHLDAASAQGSQRIYMDQQGADGLIAYRHGPRGAQTYPHKDRPTTSAPFYSWINWEVYSIGLDIDFLKDAYVSGTRYMNWLIKERDLDQDGTFEWGPYGIIENVRDWYNAVFQVSEDRFLDVDKEDISDELECLDLSLMVCKEMRSLSKMAHELGDEIAADTWDRKADNLAKLINERMWDNESNFYYSVNMKDHSFHFMTRDLRRQEIIGFLPLWAEACPEDKVDDLISTLTDTTKFWRPFGIPTLAADDPWYSANVDYCCKWNGPVWLLWNYMVFHGLLNYGYTELAEELSMKVIKAVEIQLSKNHNFWESYSPDNTVINSPSNYIWDTIISRFYLDLAKLEELKTN
jgi:hypothetical protein